MSNTKPIVLSYGTGSDGPYEFTLMPEPCEFCGMDLEDCIGEKIWDDLEKKQKDLERKLAKKN